MVERTPLPMGSAYHGVAHGTLADIQPIVPIVALIYPMLIMTELAFAW